MTIDDKISIIREFLLYCKNSLGIKKMPNIKFVSQRQWTIDNRSFGRYVPSEDHIEVYIGNRNLADILRTLSHELVHHKQKEENRLEMQSGDTGSEIENEANALSGVIMREFGKKNELIYESPLKKLMIEAISSRFTIYCDMDGVLCDFEAQFDHYYGISVSEYRKEKGAVILKRAIDDIGVDFWSKMPWYPGGQELWSYISKYNANILSSPSTFEYAVEGKLIWIKNNLNPKPAKTLFEQSGEKQNVLSGLTPDQIKNSILIDDFYTNIKPWQQAGGIGITHKNISQTISILKKFRL